MKEGERGEENERKGREGGKGKDRKWSPHFYRAMLAQSAVMRLLSSVCPSVCLSVTIRYHDHIGWNSSKITSQPNSLRPMRSVTPNSGYDHAVPMTLVSSSLTSTRNSKGNLGSSNLPVSRSLCVLPFSALFVSSCLHTATALSLSE